jgi:hypothetical protein
MVHDPQFSGQGSPVHRDTTHHSTSPHRFIWPPSNMTPQQIAAENAQLRRWQEEFQQQNARRHMMQEEEQRWMAANPILAMDVRSLPGPLQPLYQDIVSQPSFQKAWADTGLRVHGMQFLMSLASVLQSAKHMHEAELELAGSKSAADQRKLQARIAALHEDIVANAKIAHKQLPYINDGINAGLTALDDATSKFFEAAKSTADKAASATHAVLTNVNQAVASHGVEHVIAAADASNRMGAGASVAAFSLMPKKGMDKEDWTIVIGVIILVAVLGYLVMLRRSQRL